MERTFVIDSISAAISNVQEPENPRVTIRVGAGQVHVDGREELRRLRDALNWALGVGEDYEWVQHAAVHPGRPPVDPDARVLVEFKNGDVDVDLAENIDWGPAGFLTEVVRYRLLT